MTLTEYSLRNSSIIYFILLLSIIGGVWAFIKMGKKEDSTFILKSAVVTCEYAGATPIEIEQLISEPIARELQTMRKVKKISSTSYYGLSKIVVELESGTRSSDIPQLWDELRRKVMNLSSLLPEKAGPIIVNDDFSDVYGIYYGLTADEGFSWSEIREWAQRIKTNIVTIEGVEKVALMGEQQPVINIYITRSNLANFSITPEIIIATMNQQNAIVNSGKVIAEDMVVRILETGTYASINDIENQLLIASDGKQFRLGDIARVEMDYLEPPSILMHVNGQRAIGIGISSASEADVVATGERVRMVLQQLSKQMPLGMDIVELYPEDKIARQANLSFMLNLLESIAIVVVVIVLTMGIYSGSLIGLSLIFTIGLTMLCMYILGEGINRTSLAGFIIAMGMLVDNAIVVTDNAIKSIAHGQKPQMALQQGADTPKWGLLGATLIAIFSFIPLYLAPSSVAEIVKPLFIVIAISLLVSWFMAMTQVPIFGIWMLRSTSNRSIAHKIKWYDTLLRNAIQHRWWIVVGVLCLFLSSIYLMGIMPQNFFPQLDKPYFRADVILPEGFDISATEQNMKKMTDWLVKQHEVKRVSTTSGSTPLRYYLASSSVSHRPNYGNILVEVNDKHDSESVKKRFDQFVADSCPDVWLRSSLFKLSPVPDATIEIGFVGNNIDTLLNLTTQVEQIMWADNQTTNIRNSWGNRIPAWNPIYSQIKGQRIGVSRRNVAEWITLATQGYPMSDFRRGDEFIPIVLKSDEMEASNLSSLQSIPIFSQNGKVFSIEQASSKFDFNYQIGMIEQYNRRRSMKAQCDPVADVNTQQLFNRLIAEVKAKVHIPEGYSLQIFGEQESQKESNQALAKNIPLAIILIFIILLLLFGNYRDSIAILLMTPLIFIGVVVGLLITDNNFDFFSLLGLLGLVGMNVKNAVILISSIKERLSAGHSPFNAIISAAHDRLVPVCVASITTILALIPLLFDSLFAGMAATIMGGLFIATILTMIVLPVVYAIIYNIKTDNK